MKQEAPRRLARRTFLKGALATAPLLAVGSSLTRPGLARASSLGPVTIGPSTTTELGSPSFASTTAWYHSSGVPVSS